MNNNYELEELKKKINSDLKTRSYCAILSNKSSNFSKVVKKIQLKNMNDLETSQWFETFAKQSTKVNTIENLPNLKIDVLLKKIVQYFIPLSKSTWLIKFFISQIHKFQHRKDACTEALTWAIISQSKIVFAEENLLVENEEKKILVFFISLLNWIYIEGLISLDLLADKFIEELKKNCDLQLTYLIISIIFHYLHDILINMPTINKLQIILDYVEKIVKTNVENRQKSQNCITDYSSSEKEIYSHPDILKINSCYSKILKTTSLYFPQFLSTEQIVKLKSFEPSPNQELYLNSENSLVENRNFIEKKKITEKKITEKSSDYLELFFENHLNNILNKSYYHLTQDKIIVNTLFQLNSWNQSLNFDSLYKAIFDNQFFFSSLNEKILSIIFEWSITSLRFGNYRIYLLSSLISKYSNQMQNQFSQQFFDFVISFIENQSFESNQKSLLLGDLIRSKLFSFQKYSHNLIARGIFSQKRLDLISITHKQIFLNIPLIDENDKIERNNVILDYFYEYENIEDILNFNEFIENKFEFDQKYEKLSVYLKYLAGFNFVEKIKLEINRIEKEKNNKDIIKIEDSLIQIFLLLEKNSDFRSICEFLKSIICSNLGDEFFKISYSYIKKYKNYILVIDQDLIKIFFQSITSKTDPSFKQIISNFSKNFEEIEFGKKSIVNRPNLKISVQLNPNDLQKLLSEWMSSLDQQILCSSQIFISFVNNRKNISKIFAIFISIDALNITLDLAFVKLYFCIKLILESSYGILKAYNTIQKSLFLFFETQDMLEFIHKNPQWLKFSMEFFKTTSHAIIGQNLEFKNVLQFSQVIFKEKAKILLIEVCVEILIFLTDKYSKPSIEFAQKTFLHQEIENQNNLNENLIVKFFNFKFHLKKNNFQIFKKLMNPNLINFFNKLLQSISPKTMTNLFYNMDVAAISYQFFCEIEDLDEPQYSIEQNLASLIIQILKKVNLWNSTEKLIKLQLLINASLNLKIQNIRNLVSYLILSFLFNNPKLESLKYESILLVLNNLDPDTRYSIQSYMFDLIDSVSVELKNIHETWLQNFQIKFNSIEFSNFPNSNSPIEFSNFPNPQKFIKIVKEFFSNSIILPITDDLVILERQISFLEKHIIPILDDFSKWDLVRLQIHIRIFVIKYFLPITSTNKPESVNNSEISGKSKNELYDRLTSLLLNLLSASVLQTNVIDNVDLWTLTLECFQGLILQQLPSTRRKINQIYNNLILPPHLRLRLDLVIKSTARQEKPSYIINSIRMLRPKSLDPFQDESIKMNQLGITKIPRKRLNYTKKFFESLQTQIEEPKIFTQRAKHELKENNQFERPLKIEKNE